MSLARRALCSWLLLASLAAGQTVNCTEFEAFQVDSLNKYRECWSHQECFAVYRIRQNKYDVFCIPASIYTEAGCLFPADEAFDSIEGACDDDTVCVAEWQSSTQACAMCPSGEKCVGCAGYSGEGLSSLSNYQSCRADQCMAYYTQWQQADATRYSVTCEHDFDDTCAQIRQSVEDSATPTHLHTPAEGEEFVRSCVSCHGQAELCVPEASAGVLSSGVALWLLLVVPTGATMSVL